MMRFAAYGSIAIIVAWTGLTIFQIWFEGVSGELYVKLTITAGLALVALVIVALIHREYGSEASMRKDRYID